MAAPNSSGRKRSGLGDRNGIMSDTPEKRRLHGLRWVAAISLLLLTAMLVAPFLLTTQLVRLALWQAFPANSPSVGSAALSPSGTLVLHDLVLRDTEALAQQPLVSVREVAATFGWAALLSRQIHRLHAEDVTVYARSNGPSPLSLLALFFARSQSGPPAEFTRGPLPLWIGTLSVQGMIHLEPVSGFGRAKADWPLALHMTMSGDRRDPSRQLRLAIGEAQQLPEKIPEQPSVAAPEPARSADAAFSLRVEVETQPAAGGTRVVVHRLAARQAALTIEADALRRYATKLPADLHGPIETSLGALDMSGLIGSGTGEAMGFSGTIRLQDLSVRAPAGGKYAFALDRLTMAGSVESRIDRWAAQIFDGHLSGSLAWDLVTHAVPRCDLQLKSINMHEALANISPEHLDAEGNASGVLQLVLSTEGEVSGSVDLAFDGPGILRIGEIEEVKQMLVGNFGLDLANLAMRDLKHYPFKEGRLYLESVGKNSQLKIKFVRQPRTEAEVTPPHKGIINGQEVWVGSLVVPTIDMTIPLTGKSLAEILALVSGVHPLIEAVTKQ